MSKCILCGQRNVDGAIDQYGDFICVDCWALGDAKMNGRTAKTLAPVPGFDYSGLNYGKILDCYNGKAGDK
jgi:hypothetical protein